MVSPASDRPTERSTRGRRVEFRVSDDEYSELAAKAAAADIILYAAFDKTFFLELLETVCGAAIIGTSLNV